MQRRGLCDGSMGKVANNNSLGIPQSPSVDLQLRNLLLKLRIVIQDQSSRLLSCAKTLNLHSN